ncbi:diffusible signal factor-reguated Ax21 faimly protein [Pseudoxanthomonas mexicana]|uniref:diffusible signal factor-reguated Ax21 faimly protein n=1 Tax=Pseudoxanthomonas mexicana TaxID=128785 RepID=UPI00398B0C54
MHLGIGTTKQENRGLLIMKKSLLALTLLAAAPFAASAADGVSYNYVEGGYVASNTDIADADGWALKGSVALHPNFHLFGDYQSQELDDFQNVDINNWRLGVGYNHGLSQRVDLLTRVAYERYDIDYAPKLDGYSVEVGVNGAMTHRLNGYALVGYENGDEYDGDFYGRLGAQVKFSPNWSASADVKFSDGDTQWFVGPRFSW